MRKFWASVFEVLWNWYLLLPLDRFITYVYDLLFQWIARWGPLTPNNFTNHYRAGGTKERKILCSRISKITLVCFLLWLKKSYFSFLKSNDNVWCIKNQTNHSSKTLLSLVRFLMHQTLLFNFELFWQKFTVYRHQNFPS